MANRDITVRIKAEIGAFKRDMAAAADAAKKTAYETEKAGKGAESGIGKLAQTAQTHEKAWGQVSNGMVVSGTAIVGALALSGKAAMDWESAWTGVTKTVDGTPAQLAEVEGGLRNLARTLPSTHAEIAGVAEAAGQLGVARDDVVGFTKTMIDLGESTNLTAEDAATNIAQISNVMGTMEREGSKGVERFGSALVALGNDGASTEAEILSMAQRIAGAGASLNASEADVLALSNTLASMGVRAELGGGVATRVLLKMRTAVDEGGESLESFATVAGTSADEFAAKFSSSPMEALQLVAEGIARTNDAGGNLTATLSEMGIKGTEETQVMLALANSGDLLTESLELGAKAWEENTALAEEAGKRYETAQSKIRIAWNNIKDAGIDAGSVLLPAVASIAEAVADLVGAWQDLPDPVKTVITVLGGVAGVALLAGGAFAKFAPKVVGTVNGLRDLAGALRKGNDGIAGTAKTAGGSVGAMSKMEKAALGVAAAYTAIATAAAIASDARKGFDKKVDSSEFENALTGLSEKGEKAAISLDKVFQGTVATGGQGGFGGTPTAVNDLASAMDRLYNTSGFDNINDFLGTWLPGVESGSEVVRGNIGKMDQALSDLAGSGNFGDAAAGFKSVMDSATERGADVQDVIDMFPQYRDAAYQALTANGETQVSQERLVQAMLDGLPAGEAAAQGATTAADGYEKAAKAAEKAAQKVDDFYAAMVNAGMIVLGEREAMRALEESFAAATAAFEQNGATLDTTTEKGRANQAALDGIAEASFRAMEAQRANGAETSALAGTLAEGREAFIQNAVAMGMSEKAAGALADEIGLIPGNVYIAFDSNTDSLAGKLTEIHELVQSTPDGSVTIEENSPAVIAALEALGYIVTTLPDGRIQVSETGTDATGKKIDATAGKKRTAKINADAITGAAEAQLNHTARNRSSLVTQTVAIHTRYTSSGSSAVHRGGAGGQTGNFMGGKLPSRKDGGKLPYTGLGRDMILGVASDGRPVANVDDGEWVIREKSANKYDRVLGMINRDDPAVQHLASFANGGAVGRAEKRVKDLQKSYSAIDGKKANRARKQAAKDQLDAAKEELKAAKAQAKLSAEARKAERERQGRLSEARFDLRRDLKRGDIVDSFTSGSGMSVVDRLFEQSFNKDLSKGKRSSLRSTAYGMESQLLKLEKRSESLTKKLEKAVDKRDELLSAQGGVQSSMVGAFDLGGLAGKKNQWGYDTHVGKRGLLSFGKSLASGAKKLSGKVAKLQKLGFNENMIQQVIDEWTQGGTFELADAMLSMNKSERGQFNRSFRSLERYGLNTGESLTNAMSKGGIDAAQGLVKGLESKSKTVDNAFYKLGKNAEKAFKRSLGIKSPSRVMMAAGVNVGEGAELGILSKVGDVQSAAEQLMTPPALTVPPSYEVARYAQAQASPSIAIDYNQLAAAMANVQINSPVVVDRNAAARITQIGNQRAAQIR